MRRTAKGSAHVLFFLNLFPVLQWDKWKKMGGTT